MKKLTKKAYLQEHTQYPELAKKVLTQLNTSWKDLTTYTQDYLTASNGISGFIYYTETKPFAKRNIELILEALSNYQEETDCFIDDLTLNNLAWFALETITHEIYRLLEEV